MSHVSHDLHAEFPDHAALLHDLKVGDTHFQRVADRYHDLNREIHRIEAGVEAASDFRIEDLKKERLVLLDEVATMLKKAETA